MIPEAPKNSFFTEYLSVAPPTGLAFDKHGNLLSAERFLDLHDTRPIEETCEEPRRASASSA